MGCSQSRDFYYNRYENPTEDINGKIAGPFLRTNKADFEEAQKNMHDKTVIEKIIDVCKKNKNRECLGFRKATSEEEPEKNFTFFTYGKILTFAKALAKNLKIQKLSNRVESDLNLDYEFVGIYSRNSVEWMITDLACQMMTITSVTFYATLGELAFEHICNQTQVKTICVSPENIPNLIKYKQKFGLNSIQNVILFDMTLKVPETAVKELNYAGLQVFLFSDLIVKDKITMKGMQLNLSKPDTTVTLCYTSGTTALPKGAEISQRNFYAQINSNGDCGYAVTSSTVHYSYLPLPHIMERMLVLLMMSVGAKIGFVSGDVRKYFREDMEILEPTVFFTVPRLLNTIRQLIFSEFEKLPPGCSKNLVQQALRVKKENLLKYGELTHALYDALVFKKVRAKFGGKIEAILSGSAPLTKDLADDIKILFSAPLLEGYGLTETCGGGIISNINDLTNECSGGCTKNTKIKLVEVPEMNYGPHTTLNGIPSPTGEICFYSPAVFKGYYQNPEETKKALDSEGWLHTGDVGRILPDNQGLKIIDRVKEIFKLSQGEYIAPSKLENIYSKSRFVLQICIYGDSTKNHIIAIIVPNPVNLIELLKFLGKWNDNSKVEDFFTDKEVIEAVIADLDALAKDHSFNSLEKVTKFAFSPIEFSPENGCLTPTMKLVRRKVAELFKSEIAALYS